MKIKSKESFTGMSGIESSNSSLLDSDFDKYSNGAGAYITPETIQLGTQLTTAGIQAVSGGGSGKPPDMAAEVAQMVSSVTAAKAAGVPESRIQSVIDAVRNGMSINDAIAMAGGTVQQQYNPNNTSGGGSRESGGGSNTGLIIGLVAAGLAVAGLVTWLVIRSKNAAVVVK